MSYLRDLFVTLKDSPNLDSFGRLRISPPHILFDSSFRYDLAPLIFFETESNGGTVTHAPNTASATLATVATANSLASMQSKAYLRYTPGKSRLAFMTQVFGAAQASVVKRAGVFDANDGTFLEQNGVTDVAFVVRTSTSGSAVDNRTVQADWSLDKLDGTGKSGITLDLSKDSILVMDLQYLGMGRVRFGFDIGGKIIYAHESNAANVLTVPYMRTATLPVRWETRSVAGAVGSLSAGCAAVFSEGGVELESGYIFSQKSGAVTAGNGTRTAIIAIRPAASFNSITNRIPIVFETAVGMVTGNNPVIWELLYNPTITGGSWAAADGNSATEYNVTASSMSGGVCIATFMTPASAVASAAGDASVPMRYPIVLDESGANPIAFALVAQGIGATSAVYGSLSWREGR